MEDVARRARGARARRRDHDRRLRPVRVPGHTLGRHRHPGDPGLLAVRHRRRLRQGAGEHPRDARKAAHLRPGRQPGRQPDPGALDQHRHRGPHPDRRDPLGRGDPAGCQLAAGPRAVAVRRHGGRRLLLDLPGAARARAPQVERERGRARRAPCQGAREGPGRQVRRGAGVHRRPAGP